MGNAGGGWKRPVNGFTNPKPPVSSLGQCDLQLMNVRDKLLLRTTSRFGGCRCHGYDCAAQIDRQLKAAAMAAVRLLLLLCNGSAMGLQWD